MQVPRPPTVGDPNVVSELRSVLFSEPILGAIRLHPRGYGKVILLRFLGAIGPILSRRATEPLPPTILYLAVTPVDVRLFSKSGWSGVFEIGRWKNGTYRASVRGAWLEMELERLGRVAMKPQPEAREVVQMVQQAAVGPVI